MFHKLADTRFDEALLLIGLLVAGIAAVVWHFRREARRTSKSARYDISAKGPGKAE